VDVETLINTVVRGALSGRRKPSRKAGRFLTGGGAPFGRAGGWLTLAGLAWGVIEAATRNTAVAGQAGGAPAGTTWPPDLRRAAGQGVPGQVGPPPLPTSAPASTPPPPPLVPPPLPGSAQSGGPGAASPSRESAAPAPSEEAQLEGVLRVVRLTIAAAGADGTLTPGERDSILAQARAVGIEPQVLEELRAPTPVDEIVSGLAGSERAPDLYTLAFTIVRADASVTAGERAWLERLAALLRLDPDTAARLERAAGARIDEGPDADAGGR
jgi:tellurite resistance protein